MPLHSGTAAGSRPAAEEGAIQNRREFLGTTGVATAVLLAQARRPAQGAAPARGLPALPPNPRTAGMPARNLGRAGFRVGVFSLGVNYIDTSSIYGGPERWNERHIGQVTKRRRSEVLLTRKTKERTRDGSMRMIEQSRSSRRAIRKRCASSGSPATTGRSPSRRPCGASRSTPSGLAREFTPLSAAQMAALAERAAPCSRQALFFRFFDRA